VDFSTWVVGFGIKRAQVFSAKGAGAKIVLSAGIKRTLVL